MKDMLYVLRNDFVFQKCGKRPLENDAEGANQMNQELEHNHGRCHIDRPNNTERRDHVFPSPMHLNVYPSNLQAEMLIQALQYSVWVSS